MRGNASYAKHTTEDPSVKERPPSVATEILQGSHSQTETRAPPGNRQVQAYRLQEPQSLCALEDRSVHQNENIRLYNTVENYVPRGQVSRGQSGGNWRPCTVSAGVVQAGCRRLDDRPSAWRYCRAVGLCTSPFVSSVRQNLLHDRLGPSAEGDGGQCERPQVVVRTVPRTDRMGAWNYSTMSNYY